MMQLVYVPSSAEIVIVAVFLLIMTGLLTHLATKK